MINALLPARAFFTTRGGGVSTAPYDSLNLADHVGDLPEAVRANREAVGRLAGAPVVFMRPDHGTSVAWVDLTHAHTGPPVADILITSHPGVALAALGADCVMVLAHEAHSGAVLAAHIGRRGLEAGAVDAAVEALKQCAAGDLGAVTVSIGPAICALCYEVSEELRDRVAAIHPAAAATTSWGTPSLDIPGAIVSRLAALGVNRVTRSERCTVEHPDAFSHRREGVTGRQAGVVVCEVAASA